MRQAHRGPWAGLIPLAITWTLVLCYCGPGAPATPTVAVQAATPAPSITVTLALTATPVPATATHPPPTYTPAPPTATAATSPLPTPTTSPAASAPIYTYEVVNAYPHDPAAFTQGLFYFDDGVLYEGTGIRGRSTLRKVKLETGEVLQLYALPGHLFGEGITLYGEHIIQLTWQSHTGFVYDRATFDLLREFHYPGEGWGITHDGERLIVSDGTASLTFWDPESLEAIGQIEVHDVNGPVTRLNELEYVQGEIYANVWQTNRIARIDPTTGRVTGWIDLTGLLSLEGYDKPVDVLNGIAYDAENDRLFVTGKLWPKLFEIRLVPSD